MFVRSTHAPVLQFGTYRSTVILGAAVPVAHPAGGDVHAGPDELPVAAGVVVPAGTDFGKVAHRREAQRCCGSTAGDTDVQGCVCIGADVVLLDHDNPDNPPYIRRFHDELAQIDGQRFLATSHYWWHGRWRFACFFALLLPARSE
ncbi:hypothetical protein AOT93_24520 [Mycobacteroides sp. H110]|nr:hypothetical protein AOT91_22450 [Mycobacteroides sp. H092]KRQ25997.1 hypothetical protein AOT87_07540 [Mycobacteroides sp. H003]KRQ39325.1 hypothetical protein AOT92_18730 [Mycobacteroides sp. H101]KRQ48702.1 hypothetical protein AOT88_13540 [Mycobacteroides sp. H063]KRQ58750.1 hypothetical protein AOT94_10850 [Mycobacteroides sp. HXVII]KRQ60699.1 hypothetical protein AOT90_21110 [Mycobacteroides sp. H079]KRQ75090.1 hypothetical protein AOT93_24520 [Mycobacteroides sp. H110]KRQ78571.1 hy